MQVIKPGGWWVYVGPGAGRGTPHLVLLVHPKEIVTWSALSDGREGGWSWMGPLAAFQQQFRPREGQQAASGQHS